MPERSEHWWVKGAGLDKHDEPAVIPCQRRSDRSSEGMGVKCSVRRSFLGDTYKGPGR